MERTLVLALVLFASPAIAGAQTDPLSPLHFLVGDWRAIETAPGETGAFAFKLSVQDRVIVRTNEAVDAAHAQRPASRHDDLMVIYAEDGSLKADYFDNEGHVIRYRVSAPKDGIAIFVSDAYPRVPRYRLTYARGGNTLQGVFEVAPPDSPNAFKTYLSWKAERR